VLCGREKDGAVIGRDVIVGDVSDDDVTDDVERDDPIAASITLFLSP